MSDAVTYGIYPGAVKNIRQQDWILIGYSPGNKAFIIHIKLDLRALVIKSFAVVKSSDNDIRVVAIGICFRISCIITDLTKTVVIGNIFRDNKCKREFPAGYGDRSFIKRVFPEEKLSRRAVDHISEGSYLFSFIKYCREDCSVKSGHYLAVIIVYFTRNCYLGKCFQGIRCCAYGLSIDGCCDDLVHGISQQIGRISQQDKLPGICR